MWENTHTFSCSSQSRSMSQWVINLRNIGFLKHHENYLPSWQVNGIPLIGETHREVVNILKELPMCVHLVCSRLVPPAVPDSDEEDDDDVRLTLKELLAEFNDKVNTCTRRRR